MFFDSDLGIFLSDFGIDATLDGQPLRGVFSDEPADAFAIVAGSALRFICRNDVLPADPRGLLLIIGARSFRVVEWSVTDGMARLLLESA